MKEMFMYLVINLLCGVQIKQTQDGERKQLTQLRDVLKVSLQSEQKEVRRDLKYFYLLPLLEPFSRTFTKGNGVINDTIFRILLV